jgi:predicted nucleic acid-binding protein
MTKSMSNVVFDSHAILRFAQDEAGADRVEALLSDAEKGHVRAFVNEINLGEIYYLTVRRLGADFARRFLDHFSTLAVERVPASWEIILSAAEVKAPHALSYADCFAVATALKYHAVIATGDPEFRKVEHLVEIDWI